VEFEGFEGEREVSVKWACAAMEYDVHLTYEPTRKVLDVTGNMVGTTVVRLFHVTTKA
jgi:hypothetical protein